jgi:hypothetical protein
MCKWGIHLSKKKRKSAPSKKPTAAGIHAIFGKYFSDISMDGMRSDQKLAATITPPVKPNIPSRTPRCIVLKKKTNEAPAAVTSQVNVVAISAAKTGSILLKNNSRSFILIYVNEVTLNYLKAGLKVC